MYVIKSEKGYLNGLYNVVDMGTGADCGVEAEWIDSIWHAVKFSSKEQAYADTEHVAISEGPHFRMKIVKVKLVEVTE